MLQKYVFKMAAFSLLELIVSISIVSILLLITFSDMHYLYGKNESISYTDKVKTALQLARIEAIRRGKDVTFCKSKSFKDCDGDWSDGQIIKDNKEVIRKFAKVPNGTVLVWKSSFSGASNEYIVFSPSGKTTGQQGSFYYCPKNSPQNNMAIIIQTSGVIRISNKTSTGKNIVCEK